MTHPSSGGSVPADVGESLLVVPVWCTEGHFLYGLVNNHTLQTIRATLNIRSFYSSCFQGNQLFAVVTNVAAFSISLKLFLPFTFSFAE